MQGIQQEKISHNTYCGKHSWNEDEKCNCIHTCVTVHKLANKTHKRTIPVQFCVSMIASIIIISSVSFSIIDIITTHSLVLTISARLIISFQFLSADVFPCSSWIDGSLGAGVRPWQSRHITVQSIPVHFNEERKFIVQLDKKKTDIQTGKLVVWCKTGKSLTLTTSQHHKHTTVFMTMCHIY